VHWYNDVHRHSGIRYVTAGQRHCGRDHAILAARHALNLKARERNPARWSGAKRDWTQTGPVTLNPERDSVVAAHSTAEYRKIGRSTAAGRMTEATTNLTRAGAPVQAPLVGLLQHHDAMAPAKRTTDAPSRKMPTTFGRRLISAFNL